MLVFWCGWGVPLGFKASRELIPPPRAAFEVAVGDVEGELDVIVVSPPSWSTRKLMHQH